MSDRCETRMMAMLESSHLSHSNFFHPCASHHTHWLLMRLFFYFAYQRDRQHLKSMRHQFHTVDLGSQSLYWIGLIVHHACLDLGEFHAVKMQTLQHQCLDQSYAINLASCQKANNPYGDLNHPFLQSSLPLSHYIWLPT